MKISLNMSTIVLYIKVPLSNTIITLSWYSHGMISLNMYHGNSMLNMLVKQYYDITTRYHHYTMVPLQYIL